MDAVGAFVVEATLELDDGCDPAAVGAAVTIELCGHWQHDGPCRWPHNNAIDQTSASTRFRTIFAASGDEQVQVRQRIETALRTGHGWRVVSTATRPLAAAELALARRLTSTGRDQR